MEEDVQETELKPGEKFGYLRKQYKPHREKVKEHLLESGIEPKSPQYYRAIKKFARDYFSLANESEKDSLTGLLNRRGYERRMKEELSRAERFNREMTIIITDINDLKKINDSMGHQAGDEAIRSVADTLRQSSRPYDILARVGGDEFRIVLSDCDQERALKYWERFILRFQKNGVQATISAGVCQIDKKYPEESIRLADSAMYKAKIESKRTGVSVIKSAEDLLVDEMMNPSMLASARRARQVA